MKKMLTYVLFTALIFGANAQDIAKNALGLRLGGNDGLGGEISFQRGLSKNNRAEFNLGFRNNSYYNAFKLTGLYQWVWEIENNFNWYAGFGAGAGSFSYKNKNGFNGNGTFFSAVGDVGIEYVFEFPVMVSLDFRPEIYFGDSYRNGNYGSDVALSIRYRF